MKSFLDLEKQEAKNVRRKCLLDFEINSAAKLMNENNFPHSDAVVAYTEALIATMDVPQDINAAIEQITGRGEDVNTIVFSHVMWNRIRRSTMLQQYLYGKLGPDTQKRLITPKDLAEAFSQDLDGAALQVLVARAKYDTAPKGRSTSTLVPIWGTAHSRQLKEGGRLVLHWIRDETSLLLMAAVEPLRTLVKIPFSPEPTSNIHHPHLKLTRMGHRLYLGGLHQGRRLLGRRRRPQAADFFPLKC